MSDRDEALDRLLEALVVKLEPFAICDLGRQASLPPESRRHVTLHYALSGTAWIHWDGGTLELGPRQLALIPASVRHWLETPRTRTLASPCECSDDLVAGLELVRGGDARGQVVIACGAAEVSYRGGVGVFAFLREPMVVGGEGDPRLVRLVDALIEELAHPGPGARAMARSLLQAALVQALRGRELPWLAGLEDERLARALTAILDDPAAPHSVESLAGEAHMSRSAFARAFRDAFGEGPMSLLKQVRLSRAARLLATSDLPTKSVAAEVGYESRSAFSRSFAAHFGLSPQAWRDQHA